ncbi:carbohydrate ABC transporter permease [Paenibacillus mendelii]|uniref:Carbohydrate ABC transporter permease n=1 Tax=Paenibacillus mendelii TaxID=206163 RepID=A0ABV6JBZ8_9BACL|nr:carbohydrate ABC transporter permease [Paenibacillus mendelii]MCQ6562672.1 carbohydrate ABC transporter permease [Paenibacillus mendelii]
MKKNPNRIKDPIEDRVMLSVVYIILAIVVLVMLYPFAYVMSVSISDPAEVIAGRVTFYPKGFDLGAYKTMIDQPVFFSAYRNTILYTALGTFFTLFFTSITAYPLSKDKFQMRAFISKVYIITMFMGGGMIPTFLAYKSLHLLDSIWVMVLPGALTAWNIILMRSFFRNIPETLSESAYIDGATESQILVKIILPLSKPILATIGLFTAVGIWNDYFSALIYLNDVEKYPLQMILRSILVAATVDLSDKGAYAELTHSATESLKMASIAITTLPIMCIYPFIQKYFVKGLMVGSIKG